MHRVKLTVLQNGKKKVPNRAQEYNSWNKHTLDGIGTVSCSTRSPSTIQQFVELTLGLIVFTAYQAALDYADGLDEQVERQSSGNKPSRTERKKKLRTVY